MSNSAIRIGSNSHTTVSLALAMANRHGLISGATGTGKTVSLQVLAEGFARAGVPVFLADIKGDLSGLAQAGTVSDKLRRRLDQLKINDYQARPYSCLFWDLYARNGHPIRATVSDMGPLLLANLLELNETQEGVLYAAFKIADDQGLLLLDFKDLLSLLTWISDNHQSFQAEYGNLSPNSLGAIRRKLLVLQQQGAEQFFGEPQIAIDDLMLTDFSGNGVISVLDASSLVQYPKLYSLFLLWLIAELFEQLPEVGDMEKPKLVFFFDEAHLLFDQAPKALLDNINQVVRLIRSKGVGIYFVTQNPLDIPQSILGQLGNRIQHALRAYTPKDQKAVRAAAETFRQNKAFDTAEAISELAVGEALVSVLDQEGRPTAVERVLIAPPESKMGPLSDQERAELLKRSPLRGRYDTSLDRESAHELLQRRAEKTLFNSDESDTRRPRRQQQGVLDTLAKSAARAIGSSLGRQLVRGLLGALLKR